MCLVVFNHLQLICRCGVYALKTQQTRWRLVPFSEATAAVLTNYVRLRERYLARRSWQFGDVPAT